MKGELASPSACVGTATPTQSSSCGKKIILEVRVVNHYPSVHSGALVATTLKVTESAAEILVDTGVEAI